ncbi:MAG: cytochrome P450 [Candidatus Dormibacteraeota bacterium]|nr:cytochrome P450 [Candidatus Dormibacteraeota bacterium]
MAAIPSYPHDLFTDEALTDPHEHYRSLRNLGPVVWLEAHDMYAIPRYADVRSALTDPDTYCSGKGVALNEMANGLIAGRNLLMTDGELHARLRKVLGQSITPRALRHMEESVARLATALVEELVERGSFDAVTDLARALPLSVVPDLVGWPLDARAHLLEWAGATFDFLGPMNDRARNSVPMTQAMLRFAADTAASGNLMPGSVGARLIEAGRRGEIEPDRVAPLIVGYLAPSLDTTISAIGSAVWLLASHPDQLDALRADPSLIPNAFNESLRLESPIRAFSRVTTTATTVGDADVPGDARLVILYSSANRDERHFERPDDFDVKRSNANDQLGFGYGVHGCAGQGLARMEAHALLGALVAQVERVELAGRPVRSLNNLIHAWASLPVRVRRR